MFAPVDMEGSWRLPAIFNISQIRQLVNMEDYEYELSESREDESVLPPSLGELLRRRPPPLAATEPPPTGGGLSADSLAFSLVYASIFSVALLYVVLRVARRYRRRPRPSSPPSSLATISYPSNNPPCNHPACARILAPQLTYSTDQEAWLPQPHPQDQFLLLPRNSSRVPRVHNTATCQGRCSQCQQLGRPPPSYTKLFLEELPPAYGECVLQLEGPGLHREGPKEVQQRDEEVQRVLEEANILLEDDEDDYTARQEEVEECHGVEGETEKEEEEKDGEV